MACVSPDQNGPFLGLLYHVLIGTGSGPAFVVSVEFGRERRTEFCAMHIPPACTSRISSVDEEQDFDSAAPAALNKFGRPGGIDFKDPDAVVVIETVGHWAGLALFTREERGAPFYQNRVTAIEAARSWLRS
jgi:hypothetical protein